LGVNQFEIGVVGGGQLGRMMILEGLRTGLTFAVMDPSPDCPSAVMAHQFFEGGFNDATVIEKLAAVSRRLTFEFEHIDAATLMRLETMGCQVMPSPETLHMVQDKFRQKSFLASCALPVPEFCQVEALEDVQAAADQVWLSPDA
jgi:5-(carboxyamino)imidazole ribonucleotide synthase